MDYQAERLGLIVDLAEQSMDIVQRFSNDPIGAGNIQTASGPIKNLKQVSADIKSSGEAAVDVAITDLIDELKSETSVSALIDGLTDTASLAAESAARAVVAADSANATGRIYASTAIGLVDTAVGRYFSVPSPESSEYLILYQNVAGVATERKRYPSTQKIVELEDDIGGIARVVTGESNDEFILAFADLLRRVALGVKKSGAVTIGDIDDLSAFVKEARARSLDALDAVETLGNDVEGIAGIVSGDPSDYAIAFVDKRKKIALGVTRAGVVTVGDIADLAEFVKKTSGNTFQTVEHDTDYIASWIDTFKQVALAITKAGNVLVGGNLIFNGDLLTAEGRPDSRLDRGFMDGGHSVKKHIVCAGDSMTNGYSGGTEAYPKQLADLLPGRSISNLGVSSNTAIQIAARMGAVPARFSVVGGVIPRAGVVTLSAGETPSNLSTNSMDLEFDGMLFGVPGKLKVAAGAGSSDHTFTRSCAGDVVAVPANTPFIIRDIGYFRDSVQVIWSGRNNGSVSSVLPYIAAMVAQMSHSRFVVLSVCTRVVETVGSAGYIFVSDLNAQLKLLYPNNYVDVLTPLIAAYNPEISDDVAAHAGNTIPPSLSTDGTHLKAAGLAIVAQAVANFITLRGF